MSLRKIFKRMTALGLLHSIASATSNAMGAAILTSAGHDGHESDESALIAASGALVLGAAFELITLRLDNYMDENGNPLSDDIRVLYDAMWTYAPIQALAPLIGRAMFSTAEFPQMSLGAYVADAAVGGSILAPAFYFYTSITAYNLEHTYHLFQNYLLTSKFLKRIVGATLSSGLLNATSNAIGASVLSQAGYEGHKVTESTLIALTGGTMLAAAFALLVAPFFKFSDNESTVIKEMLMDLQLMGLFTGLLGPVFGKLAYSSGYSTMSFGAYEADAAVGMSILLLPFLCLSNGIFSWCSVHRAHVEESAYQALEIEEIEEGPFAARLKKINIGDDKLPPPFKDAIHLNVMERPQNLNPCGHSLDQCSASAVRICPLCRKGKESVTENYSLKSAIESYITHKEKKYAQALAKENEKQKHPVATAESKEETKEDSTVQSHIINMPVATLGLFKFNVHQQGKTFEYAMQPEASVGDIKSLHGIKVNLPASRIGLFQQSRILSDATLLRDIPVDDQHPVVARPVLGPLQFDVV